MCGVYPLSTERWIKKRGIHCRTPETKSLVLPLKGHECHCLCHFRSKSKFHWRNS